MSGDIEALELLVGVDDMATMYVRLRVGQRHRSGAKSLLLVEQWRRSVAAKAQGRLPSPRPLNQIGKIEVEDIVALDHIRIEPLNRLMRSRCRRSRSSVSRKSNSS